MVLLEELRHVHDQVADHRQARQRPQLDRLLQVGELGDAGEPVLAVDVHRVRAAHAFAAGAAQRQRVVLRLDADQRVEQHAVGRLELRRRSPACGAWRRCPGRSGRSEAHAFPDQWLGLAIGRESHCGFNHASITPQYTAPSARTSHRQRLQVHRLVLEPVAVLVPERVLQPVRRRRAAG